MGTQVFPEPAGAHLLQLPQSVSTVQQLASELATQVCEVEEHCKQAPH